MQRMHGRKGSSVAQGPPSPQMEEGVVEVAPSSHEEDTARVLEDATPFLTNLQARLVEFRARRAELDGNIRALEATLRIYQASSCGSSGVGVGISG
jgi:hypothetical protein